MENVLIKEKYDEDKIKSQSEDELFYFVDHTSLSSERITAPRYSYWRSVFRIFFRKPLNWFLVFILLFVLVMTYVFPFFVKFDQFENVSDLSTYSLSPSAAIAKYGFSLKWILGTNGNGTSMFYYMWFSARISLSIALICGLINMLIGVVLGAVWGYNKTIDTVMNFIYFVISNVPYVLLITILVYVIGHGFMQFIFALTITGWLSIAYFFRNQVLIIRDREYNLASRCLGTNMFKTVTKNILPFLTSVIMTIMATEIPSYISSEVFLSYIGVGLSADIPSLGRMITIGQTKFLTFPWEFWPPVAVAATITIVLYLLGQNLADASDPRTHMK